MLQSGDWFPTSHAPHVLGRSTCRIIVATYETHALVHRPLNERRARCPVLGLTRHPRPPRLHATEFFRCRHQRTRALASQRARRASMRRNAAEDIDGRVVAIGVSRSRRSRPTNGLTGQDMPGAALRPRHMLQDMQETTPRVISGRRRGRSGLVIEPRQSPRNHLPGTDRGLRDLESTDTSTPRPERAPPHALRHAPEPGPSARRRPS